MSALAIFQNPHLAAEAFEGLWADALTKERLAKLISDL
jgi:hypothetical protein